MTLCRGGFQTRSYVVDQPDYPVHVIGHYHESIQSGVWIVVR